MTKQTIQTCQFGFQKIYDILKSIMPVNTSSGKNEMTPPP